MKNETRVRQKHHPGESRLIHRRTPDLTIAPFGNYAPPIGAGLENSHHVMLVSNSVYLFCGYG